jgi:ADP-ribose pyrophosphatase YjhB (NUDIX family)
MRYCAKRRRPYYAAGVLVCMLLNNEAHVLLGADPQRVWSDFGGRSEHEDVGIPLATALRELDEETLCSVRPELLAIDTAAVVSRTLSGSAYYMHIGVYTGGASDAVGVIEAHSAALARSVGYVEKTELRWFRWADVASALSGIRLRDVFYRTIANSMAQIESALRRLLRPR